MNTEQKARAYDEALERARGLLEIVKEDKVEITEEDVKSLFPKFAESEEERIRDAIEGAIRVYGKTQGEWIGGYDMDTLVVHLREAFGALEKQKEFLHISETCKENADSFTDEDERIRKDIINLIYWLKANPSLCSQYYKDRYDRILAYLEKQKEEGYEAIPVESTLEYKLGFKAGKESEKQKEPENASTTTMAPSCWAEELSLQKEQKPVDNKKIEMTEFEQSVYDLCPVLGIEEAKATASDLLELAKKTLLKTGKVVLASNYPEGCSFEDGFHLGYNEGFNAKQKQKPAEWSEEDEKMK